MNQLQTKGIILSRTSYGEADRIITVLTPEQGKLRLMARGVRKIKSKLAGGIELFSVSDLTYIRGKSEIGTLVSSRLETHYGRIVQDIDRVQLGYELTKLLNKATEDNPESDYFNLLQQAFAALDDRDIKLELVRLWFQAQLLQIGGHSPNVRTDTAGQKLSADLTYNFDFEAMTFTSHDHGKVTAAHIKVLRMLFGGHQPKTLANVTGLTELLDDIQPLVSTMLVTYIRV